MTYSKKQIAEAFNNKSEGCLGDVLEYATDEPLHSVGDTITLRPLTEILGMPWVSGYEYEYDGLLRVTIGMEEEDIGWLIDYKNYPTTPITITGLNESEYHGCEINRFYHCNINGKVSWLETWMLAVDDPMLLHIEGLKTWKR